MRRSSFFNPARNVSHSPFNFFQWNFSGINTTSFYGVRLYTFPMMKLIGLFENEYARYAPNPRSTAYLLMQRNSNTPNVATVSQYSFDSLVENEESDACIEEMMKKNAFFSVPTIKQVFEVTGFEGVSGDILLQAKTAEGKYMVGRPHCTMEVTFSASDTQQYTYYSMMPSYKYKQAPIHLSRFNGTPGAQLLARKMGGNVKASDDLIVDNEDVSERAGIKKRDPDQNEVMGSRAVDAYLQCVKKYGRYLNPPVTALLKHSGRVMHLQTLAAKLRRLEHVSPEEIACAHRDRLLRTEWLHRLAFVLHAMDEDPQHEENLGAARACDNTRMMLLERTLKWLAINVPSSENRLNGKFDLLLNTDVIDTITLIAMCQVGQLQFKLTQKIDALALNPEQIHASDLAGLIAILNFMIQNVSPVSVQKIKILPTVPAVINHPTTRFFQARSVATADANKAIQLMPPTLF